MEDHRSFCPHSTCFASLAKKSFKPKIVQGILLSVFWRGGYGDKEQSNYILYAFQTITVLAHWLTPISCNHWCLQFLRLSGVLQGKLSHTALVPAPSVDQLGHPPLCEVTCQSDVYFLSSNVVVQHCGFISSWTECVLLLKVPLVWCVIIKTKKKWKCLNHSWNWNSPFNKAP